MDGGARRCRDLAGGVRGVGVDDEDFIDKAAAHKRVADGGNDGTDGVCLVERGNADGDALGFFQREQSVHVGELPVVKAPQGVHGRVLEASPDPCKVKRTRDFQYFKPV